MGETLRRTFYSINKINDMATKDIKLMIIQNFIEYYTTDEDERMDMIGNAQTYVDEDWVDEIAQAGYVKVGEIHNIIKK